MGQRFTDREKFTHEKLLNELRVIEPNDFRNFVRMNGELFDELLALVAPEIAWLRRETNTSHDLWRETDRILRNIANRRHNIIPFAQYIFKFLKITQYIAQPFNIAHTRSIILRKPKYCAIILNV